MNLYEKIRGKYGKPKQILFNTEMVRAILDGKKTQTRRPVKLDLSNLETDKNDPDYLYVQDKFGDSHHLRECSPYQSGTILYVRETFYPGKHDILYRANMSEANKEIFKKNGRNWKPSIHMPKEAARLFLRVNNVRVERLQEISEEGAKAEGIGYGFQINSGWPDYGHINSNGVCELTQDTARMSFATLWNELYAEKGYGWNENPWVWVIEFEKMEV